MKAVIERTIGHVVQPLWIDQGPIKRRQLRSLDEAAGGTPG